MFNLEQAIANWRKQMLAAGIKTPEPLEELENHLREEIEWQMASGFTEAEAFKTAVQEIGQGGLLKAEFANAGGFLGRFSSNKFVNFMKRKIGINVVATVVLMAAALQLAGAPLVARMSMTTHQDGHTMVDNFWQIQWYAFVFAGLLLAGIILALLPKKTSSPAADGF
jgi:hypothetical protein